VWEDWRGCGNEGHDPSAWAYIIPRHKEDPLKGDPRKRHPRKRHPRKGDPRKGDPQKGGHSGNFGRIDVRLLGY
jgi:hypothetical protein